MTEDSGFLPMNFVWQEEVIGERLDRYSKTYLKHREEKLVAITEEVYSKFITGACAAAKNTPDRMYWAEVADLVDKELMITFSECQFIAKRIEKKLFDQKIQFTANEHDGNVRLVISW